MRSSTLRTLAFLGAVGAVGVSYGCTQITELNTTQCRSQADCLARGPEFADTTCNAQRVCEKIAVVTASCTTNAECIDRNGGAAFTCRKSDSKCVALTSPNCQTVLAEKDDLISDDLIIIGSIAPQNDDGRMAQFGEALARQEIKKAGNLAAATPEGPRRHLAIVSCLGEERSPAIAQTQIDHLFKNVQIPYLIGPITPQRMSQVVNQAIEANILSITTSSVGFVRELADKDLVFRSGYNEESFVKTLSPFFREVLEPQMVTEGLKAVASEPTRVAILRAVDNAGLGFTDAILKSLEINGLPATDPGNAANFKIFDVGDNTNPINHPNPDAERASGVSAAVAFSPHIAIVAATPVLHNQTWTLLNRTWPVGKSKPFTMSIAQAVPGNVLNAALQVNNEEARRKFFGIRSFSPDYESGSAGPPVVQSDLDKFRTVLVQAFTEATSLPTSNTYGFYDSVYLFAYALAAIKNEPVRGPELSRGLRRVGTTGQVIKWNGGGGNSAAAYSQGLAAIAGGSNIQFFGVGGSYVFDDKGDHPLKSEMVCMSSKAGRPADIVSSGWNFNYETNTGSGTVSCPAIP